MANGSPVCHVYGQWLAGLSQAQSRQRPRPRRSNSATFTLEMFPKQRYELSSYEPVSITAQPFSVDESLADKQIAQIAEKNAEYVTAAEQHEVRPGDSILISMRSFQEDGTRIPGLSAASQTYVCGKGFMPESFDREIIGMKPGEEKSFSFDGPDLDPQGNETSMTVDTTVTVLEIQEEKIPEITDEWLARHLPVFKSVADLRADIASKLEAETKKAYDDYLAATRQINPQAKPEDTRKQLERSGRGFILRETAERYAATEYLLEHAGVEIAKR